MIDGISVSIGAAAVTPITILLGKWLEARNNTRLADRVADAAKNPTPQPQPFAIEHDRNQRDHENLFARVAVLERNDARQEAKIDGIAEDVRETKSDVKKLLSR
jgi:hypothetical protein